MPAVQEMDDGSALPGLRGSAVTAALRPFFSFYGGKWRAAPRYPAPEHRLLIEPFAGSAGYATRHPDREVLLYDIDPVIVGVWSYLIRVSAAEVLRLPLAFESVDDLDIPQEARWLLGFWINKAVAQPRKTPSIWMRSGGRGCWGEGVRQRIASQLDAIRHWRVTQSSYEDVAPSRPATWFVDPPYHDKGRYYTFHNIDFPRLAQWCRRLPGQVIACEQEGADWLPFRPLGNVKSSRGMSREAVWIGGAQAQPRAVAS